jgi:hypothetical protein
MNAGPGHPALRAEVAVALTALLARVPHTEVGRCLGVAGTTITRRGEDLRSWPADDLLRLAAHDADLALALSRCGTGVEAEEPQPVRAVASLLDEVEAGGELTREIASVLRDGRVTVAEAKTLRLLLTARQRAEHQLLRDLAAIEGKS